MLCEDRVFWGLKGSTEDKIIGTWGHVRTQQQQQQQQQQRGRRGSFEANRGQSGAADLKRVKWRPRNQDFVCSSIFEPATFLFFFCSWSSHWNLKSAENVDWEGWIAVYEPLGPHGPFWPAHYNGIRGSGLSHLYNSDYQFSAKMK